MKLLNFTLSYDCSCESLKLAVKNVNTVDTPSIRVITFVKIGKLVHALETACGCYVVFENFGILLF